MNAEIKVVKKDNAKGVNLRKVNELMNKCEGRRQWESNQLGSLRLAVRLGFTVGTAVSAAGSGLSRFAFESRPPDSYPAGTDTVQ